MTGISKRAELAEEGLAKKGFKLSAWKITRSQTETRKKYHFKVTIRERLT